MDWDEEGLRRGGWVGGWVGLGWIVGMVLGHVCGFREIWIGFNI